ncbi:MAG: hypothetical protein AABX77_00645 [Nanoarchaeota archaeon]
MEKIKDVRLAMIVSAGKTIDYLKFNKNADFEEVISQVMNEVNADGRAKLAAIATANFIISSKRRKSLGTQKEIFEDIHNNREAILSSIEEY